MKDKKTRTTYLIYPKFQLTLLGLFLLCSLCCGFYIYVSYLRSFLYLRQVGFDAGLSMNSSYFRFLEIQKGAVFKGILWGLLGSSFTFCGFALVLSHRLAGPLVRLKSYLKNIQEKGSKDFDLKPLAFRKGDFFTDLPPLINGAFKKIQNNGSKSDASDGKDPSRAA